MLKNVIAWSGFLLIAVMQQPVLAEECENWHSRHPAWIFCDDFESVEALVNNKRYFEHDSNDSEFVPIENVGFNNSRGMRVLWQAGETGAGNLKLAFGRNPSSYMDKGIRNTEDFREIYYRMYLKMQSGWQGNPFKLSRASVISADDWSQAMIAHLWQGTTNELAIDPVSCVGQDNNVECVAYNDFDHMDYLGFKNGQTQLFAGGADNRWYCIEAHVKLNDAGQSNGIQEFWIDGQLEVSSDNLNFVGSYNDYGINTVFFENYWNGGSPAEQQRYFDNIVVSTQPIGCLSGVQPVADDRLCFAVMTSQAKPATVCM